MKTYFTFLKIWLIACCILIYGTISASPLASFDHSFQNLHKEDPPTSSTEPQCVKFTSFYASLKNDYCKISWATSEEINNIGFYILRSADGENWENVDFVKRTKKKS